jgi:RNA polymerase sigma factor (TIGR02999 family)
MRRILVENARRKRSSKHGGDRQKIALDALEFAIEEPSADLIALDEALTKLCDKEPGVAELVKLRYFAGLTIEQVARLQGISRRTAVDHWAYARAWLRRQIGRGSKPDSK